MPWAMVAKPSCGSASHPTIFSHQLPIYPHSLYTYIYAYIIFIHFFSIAQPLKISPSLYAHRTRERITNKLQFKKWRPASAPNTFSELHRLQMDPPALDPSSCRRCHRRPASSFLLAEPPPDASVRIPPFSLLYVLVIRAAELVDLYL